MPVLMAMLDHAQRVSVAEDPSVYASLALEREAVLARMKDNDAPISSEVEAALRLGLSLDEMEDRERSEREMTDRTVARELTQEEESAINAESKALATMCTDDEALAKRLDAELQKETARAAELERKLGACKGDHDLAMKLAAEIAQQERELDLMEARDRRVARALVVQSRQDVAALPQGAVKQRTLARLINGADSEPSLRMRLRQKLGKMRERVDPGAENSGPKRANSLLVNRPNPLKEGCEYGN